MPDRLLVGKIHCIYNRLRILIRSSFRFKAGRGNNRLLPFCYSDLARFPPRDYSLMKMMLHSIAFPGSKSPRRAFLMQDNSY